MDEITYPFDDSTWIISDTHFFHKNIGRYCDRPDGWQETIIANWTIIFNQMNLSSTSATLHWAKRNTWRG